MNTAEEKLWNYIDGTCSEEERKAIDILIAQDETYRRKYNELLALNQEFAKMELDEPSMAFTYNVMESIRTEHAQQPLKAGIDKRIIKGIAGFFILTILLLVIFVLSTMHIRSVNFSGYLPESLKVPDITNYFSLPVLKGFLFFDVVLGLFLLDGYMRRRNVSKQV
jgi:Fe2+ transport system protein B